jgi:hypothetical protein
MSVCALKMRYGLAGIHSPQRRFRTYLGVIRYGPRCVLSPTTAVSRPYAAPTAHADGVAHDRSVCRRGVKWRWGQRAWVGYLAQDFPLHGNERKLVHASASRTRVVRESCGLLNRPTRNLQRGHVRKQSRLLAAVAVAVEASARADNRFGAAAADHKGLAAAPARFRTALGKIWRYVLHVTSPYE